jgi:glyoxylase-like metal-dependent hydrolase (beta-lactamase superfamily II)
MPHEAHLLVEALAKRGLRPSDIRIVINTHFHVDHVLNNNLFPGSEVFASQQSHDWCRAMYADLLDNPNWEKLALKYYPETFDYEDARANMVRLRKFALRWWDAKRLGDASQFRWLETQPLPEGLESFLTSGHVPGHASLIVRDCGTPTIIAGDALLTREHDDQVLTMIPYNRAQFHRDREHILSLSGRILPGHDQEFSTAPHAEEQD